MTEPKKIVRRSFFAGMGLAVAAGVGIKLAPKAVLPQAVVSAEPEGDGYRLTEHVKKYYRTTSI